MDDSNSTNLTIIVVLLLFILGIGVFSFSLKLTSKDNIKKESNNEEIINEDTLREIYEMDFNVQEIDGNKISIYY